MGIFDTYSGIQLKVGDCCLNNYEIGDVVPITDGVYVAPEGVITIYAGRLVGKSEKLYAKWGEELSIQNVIRGLNPFDIAKKILDQRGLA